MDRISFVLLFCSAASNAMGSTIMKHAYGGDSSMLSGGIANAFLKILMNPWIILGLSAFGASFFFMAAALSRADLTLAYPLMSGFVCIILLLTGFFFFHEQITPIRVLGMSLILIGITLISAKG